MWNQTWVQLFAVWSRLLWLSLSFLTSKIVRYILSLGVRIVWANVCKAIVHLILLLSCRKIASCRSNEDLFGLFPQRVALSLEDDGLPWGWAHPLRASWTSVLCTTLSDGVCLDDCHFYIWVCVSAWVCVTFFKFMLREGNHKVMMNCEHPKDVKVFICIMFYTLFNWLHYPWRVHGTATAEWLTHNQTGPMVQTLLIVSIQYLQGMFDLRAFLGSRSLIFFFCK